jgi:hypothetical protein
VKVSPSLNKERGLVASTHTNNLVFGSSCQWVPVARSWNFSSFYPWSRSTAERPEFHDTNLV